MGRREIVDWFDGNWMPTRRRALDSGWDSLSRRDQVLLAVGFLLDSCVCDGVWAIVDGVVEGSDEGLTVKMPDALEAVGLSEAAEHVRNIIRLRAPTGTRRKDKSNRDKALDHWRSINRLFEEWVPFQERVMLAKLYEWYHSQPEQAQPASALGLAKTAKPRRSNVKRSLKKGR
jgi:hypothetical protein